jgi:glycosyltransferase involved in cell wall biosynthesis
VRILVMTNLFPNPYQPNRAAFNRQRIAALAARHEIRVIAPILWTDELRERWRQGRRLARDRRSQQAGLTSDHPRYVYSPKIGRRWYGHFFRRSVKDAFSRAVDEFRPQIVLALWAYPDGWAAVDLGHRAGLPVVIKTLGSDILGLEREPARGSGTVDALRRADGVLTVSRDLADRVAKIGVDSNRVRVVYTGVDPIRFSPGSRIEAREKLGLPADERIVLYIGNLEWVKGPDLLMSACAQWQRSGERLRCHVVGDGPLRKTLQRMRRRLSIPDACVLHGSRPHDEMPHWYRAADVLVLPSRWEGVPNVLLEAVACGTPYVATNVGGVPEIAHLGRGKLVGPNDPSAIATSVGQILHDSTSTFENAPTNLRTFEDVAREIGSFLERTAENWQHRSGFVPPENIVAACCLK